MKPIVTPVLVAAAVVLAVATAIASGLSAPPADATPPVVAEGR